MCRRNPLSRADAQRPREPSSISKPLRAIGLLCVARLLIPITDAGAKFIDSRYSMWQAVWSRYFFGIMIVLPIAVRHSRSELVRPARPGLLLLRGVVHLLAVCLNFAALQFMPLADAAAVFSINPVLVVLLSAAVLRERVAPRRWAACAVGFLAVLQRGSDTRPSTLDRAALISSLPPLNLPLTMTSIR